MSERTWLWKLPWSNLQCSTDILFSLYLRDIVILILNLTYIDLVQSRVCTPKMKFRGKTVQSWAKNSNFQVLNESNLKISIQSIKKYFRIGLFNLKCRSCVSILIAIHLWLDFGGKKRYQVFIFRSEISAIRSIFFLCEMNFMWMWNVNYNVKLLNSPWDYLL